MKKSIHLLNFDPMMVTSTEIAREDRSQRLTLDDLWPQNGFNFLKPPGKTDPTTQIDLWRLDGLWPNKSDLRNP